jgi:hypothetical protein
LVGLGFKPVTRWRKALDVPHENEGTFRLRQAYAKTPAIRGALEKTWRMPRTIEWRAKIAAGQLGKKFSASARKAMSRAHRGKRLSAEHRRNIRQAHLRRSKPKPWANWEDALLHLPQKEIVARTGRSLYQINRRRRELYSA